jgi:ketosteroid isomerase-like protein
MVPKFILQETTTMTTAAPTATAAIAHELVALCRAGRNSEAIEKFYAPDIVSVEPVGNEQMPAELSGIAAVRGKNEWWEANNEVHSVEVNGPLVGDDQFAVQYTFDVTAKPSGQRIQNTEVALYTVKDGKIVREQFFYHMPGM